MQELKITVSVRTDKSVQEVVDMLLDGRIDQAGNIEDVIVENEDGARSYMPEVL